jgi:hypothetical protein
LIGVSGSISIVQAGSTRTSLWYVWTWHREGGQGGVFRGPPLQA